MAEEYVVVTDPESNEPTELPTEHGQLSARTLEHAFPGAHGLKYRNPATGAFRTLLLDETGSKFLPPSGGWENKVFAIVMRQRDSRPISPYHKDPPLPPPLSKSIDKWMFYAVDSAGKSTVVCVHSRFFATFRHGTHLQLKVGDVVRIFHAKMGSNEHGGYDVSVVDINEKLDFILLRSKEVVVQESPRLAAAEDSEGFLLAGFGDRNSGQSELAYLSGIIHSVRGYYVSTNDKSSLVMGPFILGTGQSSRGDSGGACWSSKGLVGINFGLIGMPETNHSIAITEAAAYSPKNIISPSIPFLSMSLMTQLGIEKQTSPKSPPEKKKRGVVEIDGLRYGSLMADFD